MLAVSFAMEIFEFICRNATHSIIQICENSNGITFTEFTGMKTWQARFPSEHVRLTFAMKSNILRSKTETKVVQ
jgi:hypothetical protein